MGWMDGLMGLIDGWIDQWKRKRWKEGRIGREKERNKRGRNAKKKVN